MGNSYVSFAKASSDDQLKKNNNLSNIPCHFVINCLKPFFLLELVPPSSYLIDKSNQHDDEIEELFSRLEECEKNHELKKLIFHYTMSDNKLVNTILDAATLTGIVAGIGWIAKKVAKENFTPDPSSSVMNYAKFTAAMAASIALKKYLEDQKILPD